MIRGTQVLFASAVVLGLAAPAAAYRTAGDSPALSDTDRVVWSSAPRLRLFDTGTTGLSILDVERTIRTSLATWEEPTCSAADAAYRGVTSRGIESDDGANTIQWIDTNWTYYGFARDAAATTDLIYERGEDGEWRIVEADVYVNGGDFDFRINGAGSDEERNLGAILTHEFGHVLGIAHPCEPDGAGGAPRCSSDASFTSTTMYPIYTGPEQAELAPDDMMGICYLYPQPSCEITGCDEGEDCRLGRCVPLCGEDVCTGDEVCRSDVCTVLEEPTPCGDTSPCPSGEVCSYGTCVVPSAAFGDPCSTPEECVTGVCGTDGYCATDCTPSGACPTGTTCERTRCVAELGVFGDPCAYSNDCISGYCIETPPGQPYCTRPCNAAHPCPGAFECVEVDGEDVCREPLVDEGCSAGAGRGAPSPYVWFIVGGLITRRKRRK